MKKTTNSSPYQFEGRIPLSQAIPLGLQHVMAMFIGNLTPLIIVMGACGLTADAGFAELRTALLQNAMIIAGIVTLVQMFSIGPVGGKVPIVMGTSSGFLGVLNNTVAACGGGVIAYGAIMGACLVGGIFEGILGAFLKPLRKFFPAIVTGSVVIAIGLSLLGVGINYFCGGTGKNDYGSLPNLFIGMVVLIVIVLLKHFAPSRSIFSSSAILFGILAGYVVAIIMTLTMSHTGVTADGVKYTYSWVVNFDEVKKCGMDSSSKLYRLWKAVRCGNFLPCQCNHPNRHHVYRYCNRDSWRYLSLCGGWNGQRGYRFRAFRRCYL